MKSLKALLELLPRRRRRFWRYISPQRRGVGLGMLALLVVLVYGYWYLTNDRRIRDQAEGYLRNLTGGQVRIRKVDFSLFGGIELTDVVVRIPQDDSPRPFFHARTVFLWHQPWGLFFKGRLQPTKIICEAPTVTLEHDTQTGRYNAERLFALARRHRAPSGILGDQLPPIRVLRGRLCVVDLEAGMRYPRRPVPLHMSMVPVSFTDYKINFEEEHAEGQASIRGSLVLKVASGEIAELTGVVPITNIEASLPKKYGRWLQRYKIKGIFKVSERRSVPDRLGLFRAELVDVSLTLPPAEGGLCFRHVSGELVFDEKKGVELRSIAGQIVQAGEAKFELSGRYEGFEPDSPFSIQIHIDDMMLPAAEDASGALAAALRNLHETYQPQGRITVSATFRRLADGTLDVQGTAEPKGISVLYKYVPYRLEGLRGTIAFHGGRVDLHDLKARRDKGRVSINGFVWNRDRRRAYDVTVVARDAPFNAELRSAIPRELVTIWDRLSPTGTAGLNVRVHRDFSEEQLSTDVMLVFDGQASFSYKGFPYRLNNLIGEARITGSDVQVESIRGEAGSLQCRISGDAYKFNSPAAEVKLRVEATNLPLDETLHHALPKRGKAAMEALGPKGSADRVTALVSKSPGKPLDYHIVADLSDVGLELKAFPYALSALAGRLSIRPDRAVIEEQLTGHHGKAQVTASGQVLLFEKNFGLDIQVRAVDVQLDRDLFDALPEALRKTWLKLSPSGRADMMLSVQQNIPEISDELGFRFVLDARDMEITYAGFPYTFRGITGRAIATPGRVILEELTAVEGPMRASLSGEIVMGEASDRAELNLKADNIPLDEKLLATVPSDLAPLADRFQPGGNFDVKLDKLCLLRRLEPATQPPAATAPTQPAKPSYKVTWSAEGTMSIKDVIMDIGITNKEISGTIAGSAASTQDGLGLDAEIKLDRIRIGKQRMTNFRGRLRKGHRSKLVRIEDLSARSHGGRLAGFAEIKLTDPLQYGVSLSVEDINLNRLFNAGVADPAKRTGVRGLLMGNLQLTGAVGSPETRQASGVLIISKGRLYKLPVVLGLLHVLYLSLPSDSAFTEGQLTYYLRRNKLIFREIHLTGPALSIVGSGSMDMKTERLNLTFLTGPPGKLPRMRSLADGLLKSIIREIMEIRVTGSLAKPRMRTVTLRSLEDVIGRLLRPGQSGE
ncbi:MAG: AsmA-like C-terminal region-containing protein [Planctomycetota bacterium]|nr:AsmA-like C-terminal region-containing protein [Planctomycetota bacterium]